MGQLSNVLRGGQTQRSYWCEGCEEVHAVAVGPGGWSFDGNEAAPTFSPSVLVTSGHYSPEWKGPNCWCTFNAAQIAKGEEPSGFKCSRCHTFIAGGIVDFLSDCTHALAGQKRALPPLPPFMRDPQV